MKRLLTAIVLSGLLLSSCDSFPTTVFNQIQWRQPDPEPVRVFARKHESDRVTTGYGTSFAIRRGGEVYMLTAAHVVNEDGYSIEFDDPRARVRHIENYANDTAVIQMQRLPHDVDVIDVHNAPLHRGDKLTAIGFPQGGAMKKAEGTFVREGIMTCPIQVGMSGGPVLYKGRVVGVISTLYPQLGVASFTPIGEVLASIDRQRYHGRNIPVAQRQYTPQPRPVKRAQPRTSDRVPATARELPRYIPNVPTAPDMVMDEI